MSNRPETTKMLSLSVEKHINPYNDTRIYWAREVTFDYSTSKGKRVDYMLFKPKNNTPSGIEKSDFYCDVSEHEQEQCEENGQDCRTCPDLIADSKQAAAVAADYIDNPVMEFGA